MGVLYIYIFHFLPGKYVISPALKFFRYNYSCNTIWSISWSLYCPFRWVWKQIWNNILNRMLSLWQEYIQTEMPCIRSEGFLVFHQWQETLPLPYSLVYVQLIRSSMLYRLALYIWVEEIKFWDRIFRTLSPNFISSILKYVNQISCLHS